ncbi:tail completion protein gp17 [Salimicrobium album]|uniref:DUF3168 domain-containing protein n=1 Tax=Salimicrobium album TaxID=50717 RepID=A0A1H3DGB3_9BACI|nr:DUF3168 domain-containing protein [Salimicrobium album]SDX65158.1 Protein of unknown function [Salimicrobium album]
MIENIYEVLIADDYIRSQAEGRIKYYEFPPTGDVTAPYIVIDPLAPGMSADYGDNKPTSEEFLYQIDVMTLNRDQTKDIAKRIRSVLEEIGIMENNSGLDEWDAETGIFRIARRYTGKVVTIK